jgi:hypothetical protein
MSMCRLAKGVRMKKWEGIVERRDRVVPRVIAVVLEELQR